MGRARGRRVGGAARGPPAVSTAATAQRTQIKRIYNRVIPDELERKRIQLPFGYGDDLEVSGPGIRRGISGSASSRFRGSAHPSVPETRFLDGIESLPVDRERYLLKPLFSFAGGGIIFAPTDAQIAAIPMTERKNYILQERINFTPVIDTPEGPAQAEIRIMYCASMPAIARSRRSCRSCAWAAAR